MSFLRNINPTGAIADFRNAFSQAGPARWRYAALAAMCTFGTFGVMAITQNWTGERRLPKITYINSWPEDRTAAETKAFILANQQQKELREKEQAEADAAAQKLWMAVGRASGMDVDTIKKQADADAAKAKAKADAKVDTAAKPDNAPKIAAPLVVQAPVGH